MTTDAEPIYPPSRFASDPVPSLRWVEWAVKLGGGAITGRTSIEADARRMCEKYINGGEEARLVSRTVLRRVEIVASRFTEVGRG